MSGSRSCIFSWDPSLVLNHFVHLNAQRTDSTIFEMTSSDGSKRNGNEVFMSGHHSILKPWTYNTPGYSARYAFYVESYNGILSIPCCKDCCLDQWPKDTLRTAPFNESKSKVLEVRSLPDQMVAKALDVGMKVLTELRDENEENEQKVLFQVDSDSYEEKILSLEMDVCEQNMKLFKEEEKSTEFEHKLAIAKDTISSLRAAKKLAEDKAEEEAQVSAGLIRRIAALGSKGANQVRQMQCLTSSNKLLVQRIKEIAATRDKESARADSLRKLLEDSRAEMRIMQDELCPSMVSPPQSFKIPHPPATPPVLTKQQVFQSPQ